MNHSKQEKGKKDNKHKFTYECLTKCLKWKLNVTLSYNKSSSGLIFQGKGIFFEKLESLILDNLYFIDTISKIEKSTFHNFEERAFSQIRYEANDLSGITLPLSNLPNYNNEYFTEDYMNRVFYLEFDLENTNISRENLRNLIDINNYFADKEIYMNLNGIIHGKQIFKTDVRFKIDAKKIIKSIQYRLEEHKTKFIEKQNNILKSNPNLEIKNSKLNFFTKLNGNNSIGFEFFVPNFDNIDINNFQTNFYTMTNSNISLTKIFVEFNLPYPVMYNNTNFSNSFQYNTYNDNYMNYNNYNSYNCYNKQNITNSFNQNNFYANNKNYSTNNQLGNKTNNFNQNNQELPNQINNTEHSVNEKNRDNSNDSESIKKKLKDISIYDEKKDGKNNIMNNSCNNIQNIPNPQQEMNHKNYYNNGNNSNKKFKYNNNNNNFGNNDYYNGNGPRSTRNSYKNGGFNEKQRVYFDTINGGGINNFKNFSNSNINSNKINNNLIGTNNGNRKYAYDNQQISNSFNSNLNKTNSNPGFDSNSNYTLGLSPIILSKGFEDKFNTINKANNFNNLNNNPNSSHGSSKLSGLQILLTLYEGMCNFLIFAKSCTPYVSKSVSHLLDDTTVLDYFKSFEKISAYGLDINFINDQNENISANYSPTLSSLDLTINDKLLCQSLIEEAEKLFKNGNVEKNELYKNEAENKVVYEYVISENFSFTNYSNEKIKIDYNENKPPHMRLILSDQFEFILNKLPALKKIEISKIDKNSWFSILWTPFKCSKQQFYNTSFLSYYQFNQPETDNYLRDFTNYYEIPIIGILPIKFDENIWLKKISKLNSSNFSFTTEMLDFRLTLNDSINNIHEFVYSKTAKTSIDYEFYLKSHM